MRCPHCLQMEADHGDLDPPWACIRAIGTGLLLVSAELSLAEAGFRSLAEAIRKIAEAPYPTEEQ